MKRQRLVAVAFALVCLVLAGGVLRHFRVPIVGPVSAQGSRHAPLDDPSTSPLAPASRAVRKAATAAIQAQLQAFLKDDYQTAIRYQSSNLKRNFQSPAGFRQMMTTAYPEFAHYKSVKFGDVRADARGKHAIVQVTLTGQDGVTLRAIYMMVKESQGYRVDGVAGGARQPLPIRPGANVDA